MFCINEYAWNKKLRKEVFITGVEYTPDTKKMIYLCEDKNEVIHSFKWEDLIDLRYTR